ncbi:MAG: hypothetical protein RMK84_16850 [Oscillochloridaceae bacterium]|nr:hypothetical protein [Chloroflexaceae bacterium]MDW8391793.1 hypothetical protein [Oscillochloridaceae bacterium]
MAWLALLALMLMVAAIPGIALYLENLRSSAADPGDAVNDGAQQIA